MHAKNQSEIAPAETQCEKIILLIDDDEDEHEIFLSALKHTNTSYKFVSAHSCDNAIALLKHLQPDVIFVDVNMPKTNGIICLQEIKKMKRISHVPVYMYSTGMNAHDGKKAVQLGAVDYIIKPNSITSLSNLLKKILN